MTDWLLDTVPAPVLALLGIVAFLAGGCAILWGGAWVIEGFRHLPWPSWVPTP